MQTLEIIKSKFLGSFISRFSVGDTWDFCIGEYWLVAQNVIAENEDLFNALLSENFPYFKNSVDRENVSKSAIVTAAMRRKIVGVELDKACNLAIEFDGKLKLLFPTNAEIVDWQWCLNKTGVDPYIDYIVACFGEGEIEVNEKQA